MKRVAVRNWGLASPSTSENCSFFLSLGVGYVLTCTFLLWCSAMFDNGTPDTAGGVAAIGGDYQAPGRVLDPSNAPSTWDPLHDAVVPVLGRHHHATELNRPLVFLLFLHLVFGPSCPSFCLGFAMETGSQSLAFEAWGPALLLTSTGKTHHGLCRTL